MNEDHKERRGAARKKVLIAEDVGLFFELEESILWRNDIDILVAQTGQQALEMIKQERPDLVLIDLNMPEMSGDECCRLVKNDPELRSVPVVILSHASWEEDLDRARIAGCDDIVLKPINREHFLKTIREILHIADRTSPRIPARLKIHSGRLTDDLFISTTVDIGTGGAFYESEEVYPIDTPLSVTLFLPGVEKAVKCRAKVAWVNTSEIVVKPMYPVGMGIQFVDLNPDYRDLINEFVTNELGKKSSA